MVSVPEISVILPFYNARETLARAISSILSQEYFSFELILIDNCSDDGSSDIARSFESENPHITLLREPRKGVVHASNRGAEASRGRYICRMDADDEAMPGKLGIQSAYLDKHPKVQAVAGLVENIPHKMQAGGIDRFVQWSNTLRSYEEIYLNRYIELPLVNPTLMWRRETMDRHGLYRTGDFPEDYEMILRWLDAGVRIEKVPETVLKWYDSDDRLTRTDHHYSEKAFYTIKSKYLAEWLRKHNPHHPDVTIWGASRISRRRARMLENEGIRFSSFVDTRKNRQIGKKIIYYLDLPEAGKHFILSYIRQMDNRDRIRLFLEERGYSEGVDFLMVS